MKIIYLHQFFRFPYESGELGLMTYQKALWLKVTMLK